MFGNWTIVFSYFRCEISKNAKVLDLTANSPIKGRMTFRVHEQQRSYLQVFVNRKNVLIARVE